MLNTSRTAVVTGGGSGVGRAVALRLARDRWRVAVLGRQLPPLQETAALADGAEVRPEVCDVTDAQAVQQVRERVLESWGAVDAIVNAAGTNIAVRDVARVSIDDFRRLVEVNLLGAFHVIHAFLPSMQGRDRATVISIVSDAGMSANAKAGAGYVASKFGLSGLMEAINIELRTKGVRACAIFPGDINTPLLDRRPVPPPAEARAAMLQPDDVAECVMLAVNLPDRAVLEKLVVRPR